MSFDLDENTAHPSIATRLDRIDKSIEHVKLLPDIAAELKRLSVELASWMTKHQEEIHANGSLTNHLFCDSSNIRSASHVRTLDLRRSVPESPQPRHVFPDVPVDDHAKLMMDIAFGESNATSVGVASLNDVGKIFQDVSADSFGFGDRSSAGFSVVCGSKASNVHANFENPEERAISIGPPAVADAVDSLHDSRQLHSRIVTTIPTSPPHDGRATMSSTLSSSMQEFIKGRQSKFAHTVWTFIEDEESSKKAWYFGRIQTAVLLLSVAVTLSQHIEDIDFDQFYGTLPMVVETCFEVLFTIEVLIRFSVSPSHWGFFRNAFNLIDILAAAPLALRISVLFKLPDEENFVRLCLLCGVPIIRLLKVLRRFEKFLLLLDAFRLAFEALPVLLFTLALISMVFTSLVYVVEPRENIATWNRAWWLVLVTMTTVGYGDVTPKSVSGSIIVAALIVVSVLYMAMPLGIIGNAFTRVWKERDRILVTKRTRDVLVEWGYTAHDIPALFEMFSANGEGELDFIEFKRLIRKMGIGLQEDRIAEIFHTFDADASGSVDAEEFVKLLFPVEYPMIYTEHAQQGRKTRLSDALALEGR